MTNQASEDGRYQVTIQLEAENQEAAEAIIYRTLSDSGLDAVVLSQEAE